MRRPSNKRTFHVAHRLRTTATRSRCRGGNAAHDRWRCTCASGVGAPMYRSKTRSTTSSAAASAPPQYRELDLCAGGAARSRLSGAPPFAGVAALASRRCRTPPSLVYGPMLSSSSGYGLQECERHPERSAAVQAPMPGSRRVARVTSAARRAVLTSAETGKLAVAALGQP